MSLGGYIVETDFPYRNVIVVNKTAEPIKLKAHAELQAYKAKIGVE